MAKPTLALIPASQGSKLFSVLPSSGVGDFDFSRGSAATRINSLGLIENVLSGQSRLEYPMIDGVVSGCPSLLLEPQRTNLFTYSEDFSNASWGKTESTITANAAISPDGSLNASKLKTNTVSAEHSVISANQAITIGNEYTASVFAKASEENFLFIGWSSAGFGSPSPSFFNLTTGDYVAGSGQEITVNKLPNGWYRFTTTRTATATSSSNTGIRIGLSKSTSSSTTVGVNTSDGIYIYGAQLEVGSYATSYISTNGESGGVTRAAETANGAGDAATFNSSEGVLMFEGSALANDLSERRFSLNNGGATNVVRIGYTSTSNRIIGVIYNGSNQAVLTYDESDITANNKIVLKYKPNDFALWVNGYERSTDISGTTFSEGTLTNINFDSGSGGNHFYSSTKQIQYYNSVLTDSELEELTSWTSFTDLANGQQYSIK